MTQGCPVCLGLVAELGCALGEVPIRGIWECRIDGNWYVAVRGVLDGDEPLSTEVEPQGCMKVELRLAEMAVWYNGWLAGLVGGDGGMFAAGEGVNEAAFCKALETRLRQTKEEVSDAS